MNYDGGNNKITQFVWFPIFEKKVGCDNNKWRQTSQQIPRREEDHRTK